MATLRTDVLEIAYRETGPADGPPALILHGWPDAARAWTPIADHLAGLGHRTITPDLRGHGATRFLAAGTLRDGTGAALTRDALDLADGLGLRRFAVVGHDWGARVAYGLAGVAPERVTRIAALGLGFQPRAVFRMPGFDVTLSGYRTRFRADESTDPRYDDVRRHLADVDRLAVPTLMVQGGADFCDPPDLTADDARSFTGPYERVVLEDVGHFPHREAPDVVTNLLARHLD